MADLSSIKLPDGNSYSIKDSSARSSLTSIGMVGTSSTLIVIGTHEVDNITVNANSDKRASVNISKSGYSVLGIGGWAIYNASSSGKNNTWCQPYKVFFNVDTAAMNIRNYANDTAKVKCKFWIIYRKN